MKSKKIIIAILFIFLTINISIAINNYAVDFISNQKDREGGFLIGSKPYEIKKDPDTTILLVHGVISSPKDFKELSEYLSSRNISVSAMLLPGHGTHPKDLATKTYLDWTSSVDEELDKINSKNKFLLGYSLGGTLTLNAARTNELDGIITINAPIELQNKFVPFVPLISIVQKYHVAEPESIILAKKEERAAYDAIPLATTREITKLIEQLNLREISEPSFIIQTLNDTIVNPESGNFIYNNIESKNKRIKWLEVSSHENPYEKEQQEIFEEIYIFIKENSAKP